MIKRLGDVLARLSMKYLPDPFIFAVILTFISFILGVTITHQSVMQMVINWYKGFWSLLPFSMQMCLMVITPAALVAAPSVHKFVDKLADKPKDGKSGAFWVAMLACVSAMVHWGLSLILASIFAREVAKKLYAKGVKFSYGLLGAAAYLGQMVWHAGFSGSVQLLIATPGHFLEKEIGVIPVSQSILTPMNLFVMILTAFLPAFIIAKMAPKEEELQELDTETVKFLKEQHVTHVKKPQNPTIGDRLNHSIIVNYLICALGVAYIVYHFATKGFDLNLNIVNAIFLFLGMILHRTVASYVKAVSDSAKSVAGIILQFPFYAGIMGMIRHSGLVDVFAGWIVSFSTPKTLPMWTFITSSIVNLFVPSGGGQWAVQGPIAVKSAQMLGVDVVKVATAQAWGNCWSNMLQPFWAIALLGITGLKARDIIGYSTAVMLVVGIIYIIGSYLPVSF
jgi:short-chain fatty acids transporter